MEQATLSFGDIVLRDSSGDNHPATFASMLWSVTTLPLRSINKRRANHRDGADFLLHPTGNAAMPLLEEICVSRQFIATVATSRFLPRL